MVHQFQLTDRKGSDSTPIDRMGTTVNSKAAICSIAKSTDHPHSHPICMKPGNAAHALPQHRDRSSTKCAVPK